MSVINSDHWAKGGTGVTNFDASKRPIYEQALSVYGDSDLRTSDGPMSGGGFDGQCSLHDFAHGKQRGRTRGLDEFWEVFRRVEAETGEHKFRSDKGHHHRVAGVNQRDVDEAENGGETGTRDEP